MTRPSPHDEGMALELESVVLELGATRALDEVDLAIAAGESVALVGPSGAGKTSLLRLLGAAARADRGHVRIGGRDAAALGTDALREVRSRLGFVHQDLRLVPNVRVARNVLSGRLGRGGAAAALRMMLWPSRADLREAHALLEQVGIPDKLFERTDRLSGGEQQRVAIARALFQQPAVLLADEPVASVDPARARVTIELLRRLCGERGITLVVSLHDVELALACFPRIVGLREGRVLFDGAPAALDEGDLRRLYDLRGPGAHRAD